MMSELSALVYGYKRAPRSHRSQGSGRTVSSAAAGTGSKKNKQDCQPISRRALATAPKHGRQESQRFKLPQHRLRASFHVDPIRRCCRSARARAAGGRALLLTLARPSPHPNGSSKPCTHPRQAAEAAAGHHLSELVQAHSTARVQGTQHPNRNDSGQFSQPQGKIGKRYGAEQANVLSNQSAARDPDPCYTGAAFSRFRALSMSASRSTLLRPEYSHWWSA